MTTLTAPPRPRPALPPRKPPRSVFIAAAGALSSLLLSCCCCVSNTPPPAPVQTTPNGSGGTVAAKTKRIVAIEEAAVVGSLNLSVVSVELGKVQLLDLGRPSTSREELLKVVLRARNTHDSQFLDYEAWGHFGETGSRRATLRDTIGNSYRQVDFGFGTTVVGRATDQRIRPGESATDVLVFEPPVAAASDLHLDVPLPGGGAFDRRVAEFVIPRKAIR